MFGSSDYVAPAEPKLFGQDVNRLSTNEGARALPWFSGTNWLGVTWMGDVWGVRTTPITSKVGKKKQVTGYNYYANCAGSISSGIVKRVKRIRFNDEIVWTGPLTKGLEDVVTITIPSRGTIHLHWGTEDQIMHPLFASSGGLHSPYRGRCYFVAEDLYFGASTTNAPNIQFELVRWKTPSWMTEDQALIANTDANIAAVLWDLWTDRRTGLARPESELDTVRLAAMAETLRAEGVGISPLLTTPESYRDLLVRLFEYCDAYPTGYAAKLGAELVRDAVGDVPTLTRADLEEHPRVAGATWEDTYDQVTVRFKDVELEGADNSKDHRESANFRITNRHREKSLDRPYVSRVAVAAKIAAAAGRVAAQPQPSGELVCKKSSATAIAVGSVFNYATRDGSVLRLRCTERRDPAPDRLDVSLSFDTDRAWANAAYFTPSGDLIPDEVFLAADPPYDVRLFDPPRALSVDQGDDSLIYMVARSESYSTDYDVWRAKTEDGSYTNATVHREGAGFSNFAVRAKLTEAYTDATLPIDQDLGISFQVLSPDQSLLEDEWDLDAALDHSLLAFFGAEASEIASLFDVVKTGVDTYTAKCVRGLYDSRRRSHADDSELWIQLRTKVDVDYWPPFVTDTWHYKFQTSFGLSKVELADLTAEPHAKSGRSYKPICPPTVKVNGDAHGAVWVAGNDIAVTWLNTSRIRTAFGLPLATVAVPATDLTAVQFELWSADGTTKLSTFQVSPTGQATTVTNAYLVANANADFRLRCYGVIDSWLSMDYTEVAVDKV